MESSPAITKRATFHETVHDTHVHPPRASGVAFGSAVALAPAQSVVKSRSSRARQQHDMWPANASNLRAGRPNSQFGTWNPRPDPVMREDCPADEQPATLQLCTKTGRTPRHPAPVGRRNESPKARIGRRHGKKPQEMRNVAIKTPAIFRKSLSGASSPSCAVL